METPTSGPEKSILPLYHPLSSPICRNLSPTGPGHLHPGPRPEARGPDDWVRDSHSGWHEWLELPLLLLTVQEKPVHDLVLLLRGDEVFNN